MVGRPKKAAPELLTDAELELMTVLWDQGNATARQVVSSLGDQRAYTSIATILRILEEKGFATSAKDGRALRYTPRLSRTAYQAKKLGAVLGTLFDGDPLALVRRLITSQDLDADELQALRDLVDDASDDPA